LFYIVEEYNFSYTCGRSKNSVRLSNFQDFFPAEGELLVLLLDKKHCTEVCWWRICTVTALLAWMLLFFFPASVESKLWGGFIYIEDRLSDRSNDQILV